MRVSVVTPSYNQGDYIEATIASVLGQSYADIEYIVVDGGSTDHTLDILHQIDDPRFSWISEPDRGQSDAINKGLRRATGDVLTYLNSDDVLLPDAVETVLEHFADTGAYAIYGDMWLIDQDGGRTAKIHGMPFDWHQALTNTLVIPQQGCFWRREVQAQIGLFREDLHYQMDTEYWLRMALHGFPPTYIPGARAEFRMHGESKTVSAWVRFAQDWERIIRDVYARPDLPEAAQTMRDEALGYMHKHKAESLWRAGRRRDARPAIRALLNSPAPLRQRLLAVAMLTDSYLHTPFTALLQAINGAIRGRESVVEPIH